MPLHHPSTAETLPDGATFRQFYFETKRPFLFVPLLAAICYCFTLTESDDFTLKSGHFFKFTNKSLDLWTSRKTFAGNLGEISGNLRTSPNIVTTLNL